MVIINLGYQTLTLSFYFSVDILRDQSVYNSLWKEQCFWWNRDWFNTNGVGNCGSHKLWWCLKEICRDSSTAVNMTRPRSIQKNTWPAVGCISQEQHFPNFVTLATDLNMDQYFFKTTQEITDSSMGTFLSWKKLYLFYKHWVLPLFEDWLPLSESLKNKEARFLTLENLRMCQNIHRIHIFQ